MFPGRERKIVKGGGGGYHEGGKIQAKLGRSEEHTSELQSR